MDPPAWLHEGGGPGEGKLKFECDNFTECPDREDEFVLNAKAT